VIGSLREVLKTIQEHSPLVIDCDQHGRGQGKSVASRRCSFNRQGMHGSGNLGIGQISRVIAVRLTNSYVDLGPRATGLKLQAAKEGR
jgi:hypothetical protein